MPTPSLPLILWQPNNAAHYRKQDGSTATVGDKVRYVGAPGMSFEQSDNTKQGILKSDSQGLYLEVLSAVWYSCDSAAAVLSAQEWTAAVLYDGAASASTQTFLNLGGATAQSVIELTSGSALRCRIKPDSGTTVTLSNTSGQGPKASVPNVISFTSGYDTRFVPLRDGGGALILNNDPERTYTYAITPTVDRRGYLRVDGAMATTWTTDAANMVSTATEVGTQTFQTLTLGAARTTVGSSATQPFVGKMRGCVVLSRKAADRWELRECEEYLQSAVSNPAAVPFSPEEGVCYVSNSGSNSLYTGRLPSEPVRTHDNGVQYYPLKFVTLGTEAAPYRGSYTHTRPYWVEFAPWPGYERCVWHASFLFNGTWESMGGGVWRVQPTDPDTAAPLAVTPGISFTDIPGFQGLSRMDLRKVPGVSYQSQVGAGATTTVVPLGAGAVPAGVVAGYKLRIAGEAPTIASITGAGVATLSTPLSVAPALGADFTVSIEAPQLTPTVGLYGWDLTNLYLYVNVGMDPNGHPAEIGKGVGITAWRRGGGYGCRDHTIRYAPNGGFGVGSGTNGDQRPIGGEAKLHRCIAVGCGVLTSGNFFCTANGWSLIGFQCISAGGPNDGFSAHCQKANTAGGYLRMFSFQCFGMRDQGMSGHDGAFLEADRGDIWDCYDSCMKSVFSVGLDARPTTVIGRNLQLWNGGTVRGQSVWTYSNPGMRGELSNSVMDDTIYVYDQDPLIVHPLSDPTPYVRTFGNKVQATGEFAPPPLPAWAG